MCEIEQFPKFKTPMPEDYHPELDKTSLLPPEYITRYKSLLGSANWIIILGRFDIQYAVNTLSKYSHAPREGHMKMLYQVFGYLRSSYKGKLLIDVGEPPILKKIKITKGQNWSEMYPDTVEDIPHNMPPPKGRSVKITAFVDADHARDKLTRRSVTGIVVLLNNTPIYWSSKRQTTVETSTYGSKLIASRVAVNLIVEMRYKLRMLGVPFEGPSYMLGDNMSVVLNTTIPSSPLKKKHLACAYHHVREAIAASIIVYGHIESKENLAEVETKPLGMQQFSTLVKQYLFRQPQTVAKTDNTTTTQMLEGE